MSAFRESSSAAAVPPVESLELSLNHNNAACGSGSETDCENFCEEDDEADIVSVSDENESLVNKEGDEQAGTPIRSPNESYDGEIDSGLDQSGIEVEDRFAHHNDEENVDPNLKNNSPKVSVVPVRVTPAKKQRLTKEERLALQERRELLKQQRAEERVAAARRKQAEKEAKQRQLDAAKEAKRKQADAEKEAKRIAAEQAKQAKLDERNDKLRRQQEEKEQKQREKDEKERERQREKTEKEEQRRLEKQWKEEEKQRLEEEKERTKLEEARKASQKREQFMSFFSKPEPNVTSSPKAAPPSSGNFKPNSRLDRFLADDGETGNYEAYLDQIKRVRLSSPCTWERTAPIVTIVHQYDECGKLPTKAKLFQFSALKDEARPAWWGTRTVKSRTVSGRRPFAKDEDNEFNYEEESDLGWEEGEGEDIDKSDMEDDDDEDEEEAEDEKFFVPHGYLSDGEGGSDEENVPAEVRKEEAKSKTKQWEIEHRKKLQPLKAIVIGPCFGMDPDDVHVIREGLARAHLDDEGISLSQDSVSMPVSSDIRPLLANDSLSNTQIFPEAHLEFLRAAKIILFDDVIPSGDWNSLFKDNLIPPAPAPSNSRPETPFENVAVRTGSPPQPKSTGATPQKESPEAALLGQTSTAATGSDVRASTKTAPTPKQPNLIRNLISATQSQTPPSTPREAVPPKVRIVSSPHCAPASASSSSTTGASNVTPLSDGNVSAGVALVAASAASERASPKPTYLSVNASASKVVTARARKKIVPQMLTASLVLPAAASTSQPSRPLPVSTILVEETGQKDSIPGTSELLAAASPPTNDVLRTSSPIRTPLSSADATSEPLSGATTANTSSPAALLSSPRSVVVATVTVGAARKKTPKTPKATPKVKCHRIDALFAAGASSKPKPSSVSIRKGEDLGVAELTTESLEDTIPYSDDASSCATSSSRDTNDDPDPRSRASSAASDGSSVQIIAEISPNNSRVTTTEQDVGAASTAGTCDSHEKDFSAVDCSHGDHSEPDSRSMETSVSVSNVNLATLPRVVQSDPNGECAEVETAELCEVDASPPPKRPRLSSGD